jgi:hypothetical protein
MSIYIPETLLYSWYCGNRIFYATSRGFWWDFGGGKSLTVEAYAKVTHCGNLSQKGGGGPRMVPGGFAVCVLELVAHKVCIKHPHHEVGGPKSSINTASKTSSGAGSRGLPRVILSRLCLVSLRDPNREQSVPASTSC